MAEIKEMVYTKNRYDEPIVLAHGNYHGRDFYIISFGTFPCAYIDVSNLLSMTREEQKYIKNAVDCHGGITYSDSKLPSVTDKTGWYIGWDYAHCTDYIGSLSFNNFGTAKKWTTLEIMNECKMVIDQLAKIITIFSSSGGKCGLTRIGKIIIIAIIVQYVMQKQCIANMSGPKKEYILFVLIVA